MKKNSFLKHKGICLFAALLLTLIFSSMTAFAETKCPDCGAVLQYLFLLRT